MKNTFLSLIVFLFTTSACCQEVGFDVFGSITNPTKGPYPVITLDTLLEASRLQDLYARYPSSWIASYRSVEISAICDGKIKKASGSDDRLTKEQLALLHCADADSRVELTIDYIPKNNLQDNPPRKENFLLRAMPIAEAKYPGGMAALKAYLRENILNKIDDPSLSGVHLAAVKFVVNEEGQVTDAHIYKSSQVDVIDTHMLEAICKLPKWKPAEDANGRKISQEFEFRMGASMLYCDYSY